MRRSLGLTLTLTLTLPGAARAFEPATTHAGIAEQAVLASRLGAILMKGFGRPLGLWEPLRIHLDGERGERIAKRLAKLDAGEGYAPDHGRLPALEWLVAGSVAEEVPGARDRNHYFDPTTGRGLDQGGFLSGLDLRIAGVADRSGSLRGVFTGASFDGNGLASTTWLTDERNDFSLGRFLDARERSAAAATAEEREHALSEALLIAGALLHVVADAADPAHVRDDFRIEYGLQRGPLARFVAARYGRLLVPPPPRPAEPIDHLADAIHNAAGAGLADRTARRFFSSGTLPGSADAPSLPKVAAGDAPSGWVAGEAVKHLARWTRDARGDVTWTIDRTCLEDYAAALLPEATEAALVALEHLFRGELRIEAGTVRNGDLALGAGKVQLLAEDDKGARWVIASRTVAAVGARDTLIDLPATLPSEKLAAVYRGLDLHGEPIVISTEFSTK